MSTTRQSITISLPPQVAKAVRANTKKGGYASVSEYVRDILRVEEGKRRLLRSLRQSKRVFKKGKGKVLRSLADLD